MNIDGCFACCVPEDIGTDIATEVNALSEMEKSEFFNSFMANLDEDSISIIESHIDFIV